MTKNRLLIAAAFAAACFAGPAAAQLNTSAVYVGAVYGRMHFDNVCSPGTECDNRSNGGGFFGGLQFSRYIAVEAAWRDLGHASVGGGNVKATATEADAVVNLPIYRSFSLLGRLGVFHADMRGEGKSERKNGGTFGWGGQIDFSRNFATRLEWQRYPKLGGGSFGAETNVDAISLAALVRFQ